MTFNYATHHQREHEGETDHAQCPPGSHTFDAGDDHYEGRVDEHGNQLCNDCGTPMFYCTVDNRYHHVQGPGEDVAPCFLIQEQAWRIPAPPASMAMSWKPLPGGSAFGMRKPAGRWTLPCSPTRPPTRPHPREPVRLAERSGNERDPDRRTRRPRGGCGA